MQQVSTPTSSGCVTEFRINKIAHAAPTIIGEYVDSEGVRMYACEPRNEEGEPRQFNANTYDSLWNPPRGKMFPKYYSGENPSSKITSLQ